jgi:hypothetical protein
LVHDTSRLVSDIGLYKVGVPGKIETKLDKLWWKMGLVIGGILGAANYLPELLKALAGS